MTDKAEGQTDVSVEIVMKISSVINPEQIEEIITRRGLSLLALLYDQMKENHPLAIA